MEWMLMLLLPPINFWYSSLALTFFCYSHTHPRSSTHHRISDCYASTTQGGNQRKEAEVETEAVQPQGGGTAPIEKHHEPLCASSTTLLEAGLNGKLPTVRKKVCYLSRVGHPLRSGSQGRGSRHYFCYFHCYSEKKSGKRPSGTSGKGTEAWKAAGCTRPALLEPVFQRNREKISTPGRINLLPISLENWFQKGWAY
ncbi:hypothetical protein QOT17_020877 [Balamuthia mandrillaris]